MNFLKEEVKLIDKSELFDKDWYLKEYPDVSMVGLSPIEHYLKYGEILGRNPSPKFDACWYLTFHNDIGASGMNALFHYIKHGAEEGRKIKAISEHYPIYGSNSLRRKVHRKLSNWDEKQESNFLFKIGKVYEAKKTFFNKIKVSIVMPTYNRAQSITEAIHSVLGQSHQNWRLFIVDDGSTDRTTSAIDYLLIDPRIHYEKSSHVGVAAARNRGLDLAEGEFVFYLDSDNTWTPNFLKSMIPFLVHGNLDAAYCGIKAKDDSGSLLCFRGDDFCWNECLKQNYVDMNCFGHRRELNHEHRFDTSLRRLVDWDYILRITAFRRTAYAPFTGVVYYDGEKGNRITLTECLGEELNSIENKIRSKHNKGQVNKRNRPVLRPLWHKILGGLSPFSSTNKEATKFVIQNENLINWVGLLSESNERLSSFVSIIILCFNQKELTRDCIESIYKNSVSQYEYEVIVVDNGSMDGTVDMLSEFFKKYRKFRYISNDDNLMFSLGNNIGVANSRGEYVVLLNNDTVVEDGWLAPLIDPLVHDQSIGIVGPKMLYEDDTLQCGGIVFNDRAKIPYHIYRGLKRTHPAVNKERTFQSITGACMAFRAEDYVALRGLDPNYINGCEDLDICLRVGMNLNKKILYNPKSEVYHFEGKTEGRGRHIMSNRELFVRKRGGQIRPDDTEYYDQDDFEIIEYIKPGSEPHGDTAAYVPRLRERKDAKSRNCIKVSENDSCSGVLEHSFNIGFNTMWYARGISFHTLQLAEALEGNEYSTHIYARWESEKFENGGAIYHPRVTNGGDDPTPLMIIDWARERNLDAMIFMEVHPKDWKRVDALKKAGVKVIGYENLDILRRESWDRYEIFDAFLCNTFYARDVMTQKFPKTPVLLVPWGIPDPGFVRHVARVHDPIRFIHVAGWGGLNNRKNSALVLTAFDAAHCENAELYFYTQSPLEKYGGASVEVAFHNPHIHVVEGTRENLFDAYNEVDMLLWPSKREGLGLPIVEALVSGIPVLISDGYMMKQWILPDEHGVICPAEPLHGQMYLPEMLVTPEVVTEEIRRLCADPDRILTMKRNVLRDRDLWLWDWQPKRFRDLIGHFLKEPDYKPTDSDIPKRFCKFKKLTLHGS